MPQGGRPDGALADLAGRRDALRQAVGLPGADPGSLVDAALTELDGAIDALAVALTAAPAERSDARARRPAGNGGAPAAARRLPAHPGRPVPARAGQHDPAGERPGGRAARVPGRIRHRQAAHVLRRPAVPGRAADAAGGGRQDRRGPEGQLPGADLDRAARRDPDGGRRRTARRPAAVHGHRRPGRRRFRRRRRPTARRPTAARPPGRDRGHDRPRHHRDDQAARHGDVGDQAAPRQQHVQRGRHPAAVRAAAGGRARGLGHHRHRPRRPASPPVRGGPARRAGRSARAGKRRARGAVGRPRPGIGPLAGALDRQVDAARAPRRPLGARHRAGRHAAADDARRHLADLRPDLRREHRLRRADAGAAGGQRPLLGRRPRPGRGSGPAPRQRDPSRPDVPPPVRGRRVAPGQPAAGQPADGALARVRRGLHRRHPVAGDQRGLLRRVPGLRRLGHRGRRRLRQGPGRGRDDRRRQALDPRPRARPRHARRTCSPPPTRCCWPGTTASAS